MLVTALTKRLAEDFSRIHPGSGLSAAAICTVKFKPWSAWRFCRIFAKENLMC